MYENDVNFCELLFRIFALIWIDKHFRYFRLSYITGFFVQSCELININFIVISYDANVLPITFIADGDSYRTGTSHYTRTTHIDDLTSSDVGKLLSFIFARNIYKVHPDDVHIYVLLNITRSGTLTT